MNKDTEKNLWYYIPAQAESPNHYFEEFRNNPIPEDEVLENLGIEEVKKIDAKVKEMLRWREIMYGKNSKKVDYRVPTLYFTHPKYLDARIRCVAGAKMNRYNEGRFSVYKGRAKPKDYRLEYVKRVETVLEEG